MSLLSAFYGARKRNDEDSAPAAKPESTPEPERRDDEAFSLLPPRANDDVVQQPERLDPPESMELADRLDRIAGLERPGAPETSENAANPAIAKPPKPEASAGLPGFDFSRMSIDRHNQLCWDGKPVETRHRLSM